MNQKWDIELNEWGQPARCDLLRLMIAESWEAGDFETENLEEQYTTERLMDERSYRAGGKR
jgi:hypothetical protein